MPAPKIHSCAEYKPELTARPQELIGEEAEVWALDANGRLFLEGRAHVLSVYPEPHHYRVRFAGEPVTRTRVIYRDSQEKPTQARVHLHASRRSNLHPSFDDFFPDDLT